MTVDPVTTEIIFNRLREVAATMEHVLYHSGYSQILRESRDGSGGLTDADGRALSVGGSLQFHTFPYHQCVQSVIERFGRAGLHSGDTFIFNEPYICGTPHVADIVCVTPSFH